MDSTTPGDMRFEGSGFYPIPGFLAMRICDGDSGQDESAYQVVFRVSVSSSVLLADLLSVRVSRPVDEDGADQPDHKPEADDGPGLGPGERAAAEEPGLVGPGPEDKHEDAKHLDKKPTVRRIWPWNVSW